MGDRKYVNLFMLARPMVSTAILFLDGWVLGQRLWEKDAHFHFGSSISYYAYELVGNRYL